VPRRVPRPPTAGPPGRRPPAAGLVAVGLVAVGLLVAGLLAGCSDPPDRPAPVTPTPSPTVAGSPLPVRVTGPPRDLIDGEVALRRLGPGPGGDAPVLDQVRYELRWETLRRAKVWGRTSARCAGDRVALAPGAVTRCTVTYEGLAVPFDVTIDKDSRPTDRLVRYTPAARKFVVRAAAVYDYAWRRFAGEDPRCTRVPPLRVLEPGYTGDRCQHVDEIGHRRETGRVLLEGDGDVTIDFD
jgi:hypothetical protein